MYDFGPRLREERNRLGVIQDEMAKFGGIAKATYCNYEAGLREPGGGFLAAIAAAGADVQYIITGVRTCAIACTSSGFVQLTGEEKELVTEFRQMDARGQTLALAMLKAMKKETKPTTSTTEDTRRDDPGMVERKAS